MLLKKYITTKRYYNRSSVCGREALKAIINNKVKMMLQQIIVNCKTT